MKILLALKFILLLGLFSNPLAAGVYVELSPAQIVIDTPAAQTRPLLIDMRLGYTIGEHQLELTLMAGIKDDRLNRLKVDVPSATSVLYHYIPFPEHSLKLHLIVGASLVNVDSSYPGTVDASDHFYGMSYGLGFEESFKSMPRLKLSIDWIQLYRGDELNINATSLGVHYEF